jgi:LPXTG-site transpeptidase (sortase) family protein
MKLKTANSALSYAVLALGLYLVFSPFFPNIALALSRSRDNTGGFVYQSRLAGAVPDGELAPPPLSNRLVIPQIYLDAGINESQSAEALNLGVWRRPNTSTPDKGGNTVFAAHRFLYSSGPNTFYHLDKMALGDRFMIFWEGVEYDYEVTEIKEVPATAVEIEAETSDDRITLFTCTPLWTAKRRLVVVAKPIELPEKPL